MKMASKTSQKAEEQDDQTILPEELEDPF